MDSILDRLAMKALGELKSVQPVIPARYGAHAAEQPATGAEAGASAATEATLQSEEVPVLPVRQFAHQNAGITRAMHNSTVDKAGEETEHSTETYSAWHQLPPEATSGTAQLAEEGAKLHAGNNQRSAAAQHENTSPVLTRVRPQEIPHPAKQEMVDPVNERPRESAGVRSLIHEPARTASRNAEEHLPRPHHDERGEPAEQVQQIPDIRISIGSIELRAARTENKPAPPAFRPRVSLDEFLNRKREGRA